jgi:endoglycosylceramidase
MAGMHHVTTRARHRAGGLVLALALAAAALACTGPRPGPGGPGNPGGPGGPGGPGDGASGAVAPLAASGRWLTDARGRVVLLHGVNEVEKSAPYLSSATGFGADDAAFLADEGFNAVRLGVDFRGLMPEPGQVRDAYVDDLVATVDQLAAEHIFVLVDFHQDGFAPKYNGNGLPDWMAVDDGLPNPPDAVFPLYYVQNPAMQRAFESFWANRAGPDGVGVQDHYVDGVAAVAERLADRRYVLGYDLMNEPFPGADWAPCVTDAEACAAQEQRLLAPFRAKATAAVAAVAPQPVFVEPFVLFNFGQVTTTMPGATGNGLSFHSYALDVAGEEAVVANAVAAAERDGAPLLATEFGATTDPAVLTRIAGQLDGGAVGWMMWDYRTLIADRSRPAGRDNLRSAAALDALVRPYPHAVAGTPTGLAFDPGTRAFDLSFATTGPGGRRYPPGLATVVSVPHAQYPGGYRVEAAGATVTSPPCAERLTLRARPAATQVTVRVVPGSCRRPAG